MDLKQIEKFRLRYLRERLRWVHKNMKCRCNKPNNKEYHNYGGRGITYDPRWETFPIFYEDILSKFSIESLEDESLSFERVNVDGPYYLYNLDRVDRKAQARNKTNHSVRPGMRFGRWTVLRRSEKKSGDGCSHFWCRCDCGTEKEVYRGSLKGGVSKSCGCLMKEKARSRKVREGKFRSSVVPGKRYGRWVVIRRGDRTDKNGWRYTFLCECDCGVRKEVIANSLTQGKSLSCGCLHKEVAKENMSKIGKKYGVVARKNKARSRRFAKKVLSYK